MNYLVFLAQLPLSFYINNNTKWKQNGFTIAGSNDQGDQLNQLSRPYIIYVDDDDQCIYIADCYNHCNVEWKYGANSGQVVAGGNQEGNGMNQLYYPTDVIVDKKTDSLIICDQRNRRVRRRPRRNRTYEPSIIITLLALV